MLRIELQAVPNQRLTFEQGENRWEIRIGTAKASMFCDITLNDQIILQGSRIVAETPIIPYPHLAEQGNFVLLTDDGDAPWWESFESGQRLIYASASEILAFAAESFKTYKPKTGSLDKYGLISLINQANRLDKLLYTRPSWQALQEEIARALDVVKNENASIREIDNATRNLQQAIDNLVSVNEDIIRSIDRLHELVHVTLPSPNYW